ncbi:glutathione S-transferase domain-containing protein [Pseudomonas putida S11]|nr:glutathione S-transferase domain-containing protein [Pseudomonas putida S11]
MTDLSAFPITRKWPARHPERLQLYSLPTPNGVKVSIMLEEIGLAYEPHKVSFDNDDQLSPEFISLSANNKIPAILDPNGPGGQPLPLFESGAILQYLAEKSGQLLSQDPAQRYQTLQWLMFQMGGIGPMFGQVGFFHFFAGKEYEDKRPRDRYVNESKRLLGVLDRHLKGREWMVDEYSIADIAIFPWVRNLVERLQRPRPGWLRSVQGRAASAGGVPRAAGRATGPENPRLIRQHRPYVHAPAIVGAALCRERAARRPRDFSTDA